MAKVQGPLLSLNAKGSVNKTISYSDYHGITRVKTYFKPKISKKLPTILQTSSRQKFSTCFVSWGNLSQNDKGNYNKMAQGKHMSGFNLYMKKCVMSQVAPVVSRMRLPFKLDTYNISV